MRGVLTRFLFHPATATHRSRGRVPHGAVGEGFGGSGGDARVLSRGRSGVHMYANKEGAWKDYTDDRFHGARQLRAYWARMMGDRGARYYFFGTLVAICLAGAKLWRVQRQQQQVLGLIGPKKRPYGSRLTIVLDVDETIVSYGDKAFRMKAGMVPRPYLAELLDYLSLIDAEVVLWSSCSERYMQQVLKVIDPSGTRVSQFIVRRGDWFTGDNYYEKNVLWLKRPLEDTLIVENRPLSVRSCNSNAILVDDFVRGEYMDTGQDYPPNDEALRTLRGIVQDLHESGRAVPEYLADVERRHRDIKEIPCHLAFRQLPDELARGVFYFVGDKYKYRSGA
uniref:Mitochondrial import inner membrane translocase subunit TIM50 n=1 Tax=Trypanosoma vivax (strain Y486) TaxID=1055687 RepID=G0TS13_TRYVY|nr:conserved hypothetical protein [Trypanosoma vivax Y486]